MFARGHHEAEEAERAERERKISAEFDTGMKDEWEADRKAVEESQKRETAPEEKNSAEENPKVTLAPPVEGRPQVKGDSEDVDTMGDGAESEVDMAQPL